MSRADGATTEYDETTHYTAPRLLLLLRMGAVAIVAALALSSFASVQDSRPELPTLRICGGVSIGVTPLSPAELDELCDRATRLRPGPCHSAPTTERVVLPVWSGRPMWLWQQWRGT